MLQLSLGGEERLCTLEGTAVGSARYQGWRALTLRLVPRLAVSNTRDAVHWKVLLIVQPSTRTTSEDIRNPVRKQQALGLMASSVRCWKGWYSRDERGCALEHGHDVAHHQYLPSASTTAPMVPKAEGPLTSPAFAVCALNQRTLPNAEQQSLSNPTLIQRAHIPPHTILFNLSSSLLSEATRIHPIAIPLTCAHERRPR